MKLEEIGPHDWWFVYPALYDELMEEFHRGVELLADGHLEEAERLFRATLARMPEHLGALSHLGLIFGEQGRKAVARNFGKLARIPHPGLQAFLNKHGYRARVGKRRKRA